MRRTKEEAENTKQDILRAAVQIFSDKGVMESSLEEIAAEAGVTRGAIYWHFKNKLEIFETLVEDLHQPLMDFIMEGLETGHPDPTAQLRDLCIELFLDLENDAEKRQVIKLFLMKCDYSGDLEPYKKQHQENKAEKIEAFQRYFDKAKDLGKIAPDTNTELLAWSFGCYLRGVVCEYLEDPEEFDIRHKAPILMAQFFNHLK